MELQKKRGQNTMPILMVIVALSGTLDYMTLEPYPRHSPGGATFYFEGDPIYSPNMPEIESQKFPRPCYKHLSAYPDKELIAELHRRVDSAKAKWEELLNAMQNLHRRVDDFKLGVDNESK
jgi:hypothetical protein